jgi:hypothetical protein
MMHEIDAIVWLGKRNQYLAAGQAFLSGSQKIQAASGMAAVIFGVTWRSKLVM